MKSLAAAFFAAWVAAYAGLPASTSPLISQLDVISIHVRDHAAFDVAYDFLQQDLQLPLVYGERSRPEDRGRRLYAGFSVGNVMLEPCGPFPQDAPFDQAELMRFHGLTFSPSLSLAASEGELQRRHVAHSKIVGGGKIPQFIYVTDPALIGDRLALSLWSTAETSGPLNLRFLNSLRSSLQQAKGGALGVTGIEEVRIAGPDDETLARWGGWLAPIEPAGGRWASGRGPALRLVRGENRGIASIVIGVASLEHAKAVLSRKRLLGKTSDDSVELDPAKLSGLRIELRETPG